MQRVQLLGLDFGTTTSSAVAASALVRRNVVNARMEIADFHETFRSEMVFTPYLNDQLDLVEIEHKIQSWLGTAKIVPEDLFGGGALLTGLAARADNAAELVALVRRYVGDALIATADDPCLESWLAFMGSCAGLSQAHPQQPFLHLDIGGGTTNLALGLDGEVLATGCLFVGARHIQVVPGSYRVTRLSSHAQVLLENFHIAKGIGDELTREDVERILDFYLETLNAALASRPSSLASVLTQVPLRIPAGLPPPALTLSGGVGELVYRHLRGLPWPGTTLYGDLGIDLARRLAESDDWREHFLRFEPAAGGRATVYGLLRHSTQVSGSTVFLPHPEDLPLRDVPIIGTISEKMDDEGVGELFRLARSNGAGAALRLALDDNPSPLSIRALAERVASMLSSSDFPPRRPLVFLVADNVGKVLGQYITAWGTRPWRVMVLDEINQPRARFLQVGAMRDQVIPVSFFGLSEEGGHS